MQSSNDPYSSRGNYQRPARSSSSSSGSPPYSQRGDDPSYRAAGTPSAQWQTTSQAQDNPYPSSTNYPDLHPLPFAQSSGMTLPPPQGYGGYPQQQQGYVSEPLGPRVPPHYQNYRPIQQGHPVVPSQAYYDPPSSSHGAHGQYVVTPAQAAHTYTQYPSHSSHGYAQRPSSGIVAAPTSASSAAASPSPPASGGTSSSPYPCDLCPATFTRPHDRKRHFESHHTSIQHSCRYCGKGYARVDSLKRHYDKPCDKMPPH